MYYIKTGLKKILLEELNKLKGTSFIHNNKKIIIDFSIVIEKENEIKLHIDAKIPNSRRIFQNLIFDGGLESLKDSIKKKDESLTFCSGCYVNKEGEEYGDHGAYIYILYREKRLDVEKIVKLLINKVFNER